MAQHYFLELGIGCPGLMRQVVKILPIVIGDMVIIVQERVEEISKRPELLLGEADLAGGGCFFDIVPVDPASTSGIDFVGG